ncbi:ABC transporter ATP-binding protein [Cutibacterium sp. WCA-380-WT-3A]|uniref:ABC transporter ATP-binding protein n=1 Tax=Cutibacterium porci TaxID=2605781 RepID=A0A7K0J5N9_9ACTN|nr:ABC transporter ATP-binding protein [Cutibacterium porci]MSS45222.1 ABC transporter ATP-binding protein [Cutibacterium porci]
MAATAHVPTRATTTEPVLQVKDLNVQFKTEDGIVHAVRDLSFDLYPGKALGIVGESGSGKSVTALSIMGLLDPTARTDGTVMLDGINLLDLSDKQMCAHRGKDIAMIFQDPLSSLTPVFSIGRQISDALRIHNPEWSKRKIRDRVIELLELVGIPSPETRIDSFPHQLSGGMRQRVMIAIAIANNPRVLICDEPTTALDVTIQAQILDLIRVAQKETGCAVIFITHDLGILAGLADEMIIMYAGRAVEKAEVDELYTHQWMPYTMGLLAAVPRVDQHRDEALVPIEGHPPNLIMEPTACSFAPRCPLAIEACHQRVPRLKELADNHQAACIRGEELRDQSLNARDVFRPPVIPQGQFYGVPRDERETVLDVRNVVRHFPFTKGSIVKRRIGTVKAVDGVSFDIRQGECFALVGESGCGKTTTLLEIMDRAGDQTGTISVCGRDHRSKAAVRDSRADVQIVFQDPMAALDPRFTVYEVLAEPLQAHGWAPDKVRERVFELMRTVGLVPDMANRFPAQFSGGQRQRIGVARALALKPKLLVLDEPVSALDVSIQAGMINLLDQLRAELGLSYLIVAHDLSVIRHISDRVGVMYLGRIVEIGDTNEVFDDPRHPYTRALLSAIPVPDPQVERNRRRVVLAGDLPSPTDDLSGCPFATRCPQYALLGPDEQKVCSSRRPELTADGRDRLHACHFPQSGEIGSRIPGGHDGHPGRALEKEGD